MEGTANGAGDEKKDAALERREEDDTGIRTEFERMMFDFNPEDSQAQKEPEAPRQVQQAQPEQEELPAYD